MKTREMLMDIEEERLLGRIRLLAQNDQKIGQVKGAWVLVYLRLVLSVMVGWDMADRLVSELEHERRQVST